MGNAHSESITKGENQVHGLKPIRKVYEILEVENGFLVRDVTNCSRGGPGYEAQIWVAKDELELSILIREKFAKPTVTTGTYVETSK
jgi:hypothetical protein